LRWRLRFGLEKLLENAQFLFVRPRRTYTVVGYCAKEGLQDDKMVLCLEPWVLHSRWFAGSVMHHELLHCVQHVFRGAMNLEWRQPRGLLANAMFFGKYWAYEAHASVLALQR